jgi:phosphohistidine phosphatase
MNMDVLIVRHAIAEERDARRWPDDRGRPLTTDGVRRFRKVARHLGRAVPEVDGVWSSPLARAWQTAEILEEAAGWPPPQKLTALEPGVEPSSALDFLRKERKRARVVLVGHEPGLHELVSFLLSGSSDRVAVEMKKGGAALVRMGDEIMAGSGELLWLLPPRVVPGVDS